YRVGWLDRRLGRLFMTCRFITLVNLLAGKELFPEFLTDRCEAKAVAGHVLRWLNDPQESAKVQSELADLCERYARPGACESAAAFLLEQLSRRPQCRAA